MAFGKYLKEILEKENISVYSLSKKTNIPKTTLYSIINKDTTPPIDTALKILMAFDNSKPYFEEYVLSLPEGMINHWVTWARDEVGSDSVLTAKELLEAMGELPQGISLPVWDIEAKELLNTLDAYDVDKWLDYGKMLLLQEKYKK